MRASYEEHETRIFPIEAIECSYAKNRDPAERPPIPKPGDKVYYRHNEWDTELHLVVVLAVQSLDEMHDKNIGYVVKDNITGRPVMDGPFPRLVRVQDPWPWVQFHCQGVGLVRTWESRVRGSAGWLPLNYRERKIRLPHEVIIRPMPNANW